MQKICKFAQQIIAGVGAREGSWPASSASNILSLTRGKSKITHFL